MSCQDCNCGQKQREEAQIRLEKARTVDKIKISPRNPKLLMTGANTLITLNGVTVVAAKSIEVKVNGTGRGIVKLEIVADVEMDESIVADAEIEIVDGVRE